MSEAPSVRPARVAVLVSGRGSNMKALIEAAHGDFPARIELVITDNPGAPALGHARGAGIAAEVIARGDYPDRAAFEAALERRLAAADIGIVCLAGFMRILSIELVDRWQGRILNIHPSLLPAFRGLDTHARALDAGVRIHGATVHFLGAEIDEGPILIQAAVPVLEGDDEATLAARVLEVEHRIYPEALRRVALAVGRNKDVADYFAEADPDQWASACLISPALESLSVASAEDGGNESAATEAELYSWQSPRAMLRIAQGASNKRLFEHGANPWRDACTAATFARLRGAHRVRLIQAPFPDFELCWKNRPPEVFEATEAMETGRKRGDEYNNSRPGITQESEEIVEIRARDAIEWLRNAAKKKMEKKYSRSDTNLLIYWNPRNDDHREDELRAGMRDATADAKDHFRSVWVLWNEKAYHVQGPEASTP